MKSKLYVTTSIPYVNAEPHVGFALELVQADVIARYARRIGRIVRFQTGTDENALKNVLAAERQELTAQELVNRNAERFRALLTALDISADDFIRTTEPRHRRGVNEFWRTLCPDDIVPKDYRGLYCAGCEDFYLEKDLENGRCPEHGVAPLEIAERNYFFRLPRYQSWLSQSLARGTPQVIPFSRRNEVLSFVNRGLTEFSISRSRERTRGWGTAVPHDETQTVYVWVDALINYLSALGFGSDDRWRNWWTPEVEKVHVIGKNVWKFHAIYWPALLQSAGLPLPDKIVVHGFLTAEGRKIGKSLANAVDPFAVISKYESDTLRYYLLRAIPSFGDGDFSLTRLEELYRTELAGGIGNLVSRLASLAAGIGYESTLPPKRPEPPQSFKGHLEAFEFDKALNAIWGIVSDINRDIDAYRPWELLRENETVRLRMLLTKWLEQLWILTVWIEPFLPLTGAGIIKRLFSGRVYPATPLFPRL